MLALQGEYLLMAWEGQAWQPPLLQALTLLDTAEADMAAEDLLDLPLAELNRRLLQLRAISFGERLEGFSVCEGCGESLEFALSAPVLAQQMLSAEPQAWMESGQAYRMRPATARDLLACADIAEQEAQRMLLARVLTSETVADETNAHRLMAETQGDLSSRFETLNQSAEVRLQLQCAACGNLSVCDLDIAQFVVRETDVAARRLLSEIHRLAAAYGWSERSIVAMSAARRSAYLTLLDA